jgi:hypothetical protein
MLIHFPAQTAQNVSLQAGPTPTSASRPATPTPHRELFIHLDNWAVGERIRTNIIENPRPPPIPRAPFSAVRSRPPPSSTPPSSSSLPPPPLPSRPSPFFNQSINQTLHEFRSPLIPPVIPFPQRWRWTVAATRPIAVLLPAALAAVLRLRLLPGAPFRFGRRLRVRFDRLRLLYSYWCGGCWPRVSWFPAHRCSCVGSGIIGSILIQLSRYVSELLHRKAFYFYFCCDVVALVLERCCFFAYLG